MFAGLDTVTSGNNLLFYNIFLSLIVILLASTLSENYSRQNSLIVACFYCFKNGGKHGCGFKPGTDGKNMGEGVEEGEDAL